MSNYLLHSKSDFNFSITFSSAYLSIEIEAALIVTAIIIPENIRPIKAIKTDNILEIFFLGAKSPYPKVAAVTNDQ